MLCLAWNLDQYSISIWAQLSGDLLNEKKYCHAYLMWPILVFCEATYMTESDGEGFNGRQESKFMNKTLDNMLHGWQAGGDLPWVRVTEKS